MLKLLMKYEVKWIRRFLTAYYISLGALTLLAALLGILAAYSGGEAVGFLAFLLYSLTLTVIGLFYSILPLLLAVRYHRSLFSDEGYLTLVLPVPIRLNLLAKLLNALLWISLGVLSVRVALFLTALLPGLFAPSDNLYFLTAAELFRAELAPFTAGELPDTLLSLLSYLVITSAEILLGYTALTLGSVILRNLKIIGALLCFVVLNFAVSLLALIAEVAIISLLDRIGISVVSLYTVLSTVFYGALGTGLFFLNEHLLTKRLDLV